jgi:hypothetical protein
MATGTAFYRYAQYHTRDDTPEKLTYGPFARVTRGLCGTVSELAQFPGTRRRSSSDPGRAAAYRPSRGRRRRLHRSERVS